MPGSARARPRATEQCAPQRIGLGGNSGRLRCGSAVIAHAVATAPRYPGAGRSAPLLRRRA
eukprot:3775247-Prymnesium_polylepis.1